MDINSQFNYTTAHLFFESAGIFLASFAHTVSIEPIILHSNMNNFYTSVEIFYDPALRNKSVAVTGDKENRHCIVLAKNDLAKRFGMAISVFAEQSPWLTPRWIWMPKGNASFTLSDSLGHSSNGAAV